MYLTILMPCLNESKTLEECIMRAKKFLSSNKINGEILVVDNASSDNSNEIAKTCGARVVIEKKKGYGNAIRKGIREAEGTYIIMGDCDMSYDFLDLKSFIDKFEEGFVYVNGNRFKGGIKKGAMSAIHKIGVRFLSYFGRLKYNTPQIRDYHSGLRGFKTDIAKNLGLQCGGMEFATEIISKFAKSDYNMTEVPVVLWKDKREGNSHLRTVRDGLRHSYYLCRN